jgi:transcriptional regulator with XRE-family HTH domain
MKKEKDHDFGKRLKQAREAKGEEYTQEFVAHCIGVHRVSYQRYEAGFKPKRDILDKITSFLDTHKGWLLTGTEDPSGNHNTHQENMAQDIIDIQHIDIIKKFKNREKAKRINEILLKVERLNPNAFDKIETYVKGVLDGIESARDDVNKGESPPGATENKNVGNG